MKVRLRLAVLISIAGAMIIAGGGRAGAEDEAQCIARLDGLYDSLWQNCASHWSPEGGMTKDDAVAFCKSNAASQFVQLRKACRVSQPSRPAPGVPASDTPEPESDRARQAEATRKAEAERQQAAQQQAARQQAARHQQTLLDPFRRDPGTPPKANDLAIAKQKNDCLGGNEDACANVRQRWEPRAVDELTACRSAQSACLHGCSVMQDRCVETRCNPARDQDSRKPRTWWMPDPSAWAAQKWEFCASDCMPHGCTSSCPSCAGPRTPPSGKTMAE